MQQCTFCGAYLAEKSLTCGKCGRQQLANTPAAPSNEQAPGQAPVTRRHLSASNTQGTQQRLRQFQRYLHTPLPPQDMPPPAPAQAPFRSEVAPLQYQRQETATAHARGKFVPPKWLLAVIAALVIIGAIGVFALTTHAPLSALEMGGTTTSSAANVNATNTVTVPLATGTPSANPLKGMSAIPSCSAATNSSHTGSFTFTGGIAGTISLSAFEACNAATSSCSVACVYASETGDRTYFAKAQGKMSGATYLFEFFINHYTGPGTYSSTNTINVVLLRNNYEWESYGATSNHATIVVNADGKTGSIHATISMMSPEFNPTSVVMVTGNWS